MTRGERRAFKAQDEVPGVERLLALSDGVVAIALTLLVLQLDVSTLPRTSDPGTLAAALWDGAMRDHYTAYVVSFYVVAQFWLAHHRTFRMVRGHHEGLAWWNFLFLFTITVMPFTSSLLGHDANNPTAITVFLLNLLAASLSTQMVIVYGRRKHMVDESVDPSYLRTNRVRVLGVATVICLAIAFAWLAPDWATLTLLLLLAVPRVSEWSGARARARAVQGSVH